MTHAGSSPGTEAPSYALASGIAEFTRLAVATAAAAHSELVLFSHELDYRVYGSEEFCDTLKRFILQHRRARLRALVHTPALAMRRGHRLVELGRALSSRIEFRQLSETHLKLREEYLMADQRTLLYKEAYNDLEARHHTDDPLRGREQMRIFETLWQESLPAREFTDLKI